MSTIEERSDTTVKLPASVSDETHSQLTALFNELAGQGATRVHVDCSELSVLTHEHIWLLLQVQTQCQMQGINVVLSVPTATLFNIETLGSFIEASSSLTRRAVSKQPVKPAVSSAADLHRLEQTFRARSSELAKSTREFDDFLASLKIDRVDRYVLRTLYTEAVQNIYRHAGLKDHQEIQVKVEHTSRCLSLTLVDEGPEFDPTSESSVNEQISDPTAVEFPHFGIKMLKRLADDIIYNRSQSGKNVLRIIKELQQ